MPRIANVKTEPEEHDEIEITSEMIEAGIRLLGIDEPESAVICIFSEMAKVMRKDL